MSQLTPFAMSLATVLAMAPVAALHAQSTLGSVTVSGTAAYRQRIAMPPEAVLTVRIEDVSRADAPASVLAETREPFGARQVPIPFSMQVPAESIDPRLSYALRATITVDGKLRFTTTRSFPVLTRGASDQVALLLDPVPAMPAPAAPAAMPSAALKDTYWKLTELDGAPVEMAPQQQREVRITLASTDLRLSGFSGCNSVVGAYEQDGPALRFTQLAGNRMACVPRLMELESQVLKMLQSTTGYRIEGERLTLLASDTALARFEAVYLR